MTRDEDYAEPGPTRDDLDAGTGPVVVEFGTNWCGYCQAARGDIERALAEFPAVTHVKIADGPGRPLGRSYRVKLWPTLIFLADGREVARVVRPADVATVRDGLLILAATAG